MKDKVEIWKSTNHAESSEDKLRRNSRTYCIKRELDAIGYETYWKNAQME